MPTLNGIRPGVDPLQSTDTFDPKLPGPLRKAQKFHTPALKVVSTTKGIVSFFKATGAAIPEGIGKTVGCAQVCTGIGGIFSVVQFFIDVSKAVYAKSLTSRIKNLARAVLDGGYILGAINSIVSGLKAVKVIAQDALPWTNIISKILFPLQFISLGLDLHQMSETSQAHNEFLKNTELLSSRDLKSRRIQNLTQAVSYVKENHKKIKSDFKLSKKVDLEGRANEILENLKNNQEISINKGEEFVNILRGHIKTKLNFQVANTALRIVGIVSAALAIATPPNPATLGLAAVTGLVGLAVFGLEKLMVTKNPFETSPGTFPGRIPHDLRRVAFGAVSAVNQGASCALEAARKGLDNTVGRFTPPIMVGA